MPINIFSAAENFMNLFDTKLEEGSSEVVQKTFYRDLFTFFGIFEAREHPKYIFSFLTFLWTLSSDCFGDDLLTLLLAYLALKDQLTPCTIGRTELLSNSGLQNCLTNQKYSRYVHFKLTPTKPSSSWSLLPISFNGDPFEFALLASHPPMGQRLI